MIRLEIHPGDGGTDAEQFARELARAIGRHAHTHAAGAGRVQVVDWL